MALKTAPWEVLDDLNSDEMIEEYFAQVLEDGDGEEVVDALGTIVRARAMSDLAAKCGMRYDDLRMVLAESGRADIDTIRTIALALGLSITARRPSAHPLANNEDSLDEPLKPASV